MSEINTLHNLNDIDRNLKQPLEEMMTLAEELEMEASVRKRTATQTRSLQGSPDRRSALRSINENFFVKFDSIFVLWTVRWETLGEAGSPKVYHLPPEGAASGMWP